MHRDVKLGLALGMLVIGFAAAFCFPRQPGAPLAEALLTATTVQAPEAALVPLRELQLNRLCAGTVDNDSDGRTEEALSDAPMLVDQPGLPLAIDSIAPVTVQAGMLQSVRPLPGASIEATGTDVAPQVSATPPSISRSNPGVHTVRAGDTLSGIALQRLGSSVRYMEIYQANTDLLTGPEDRLHLGMQLWHSATGGN